MSEETFEGFTPPEKNFFPMPNYWIDICAQIDNLAELKIIQYVLRHTWGYQEFGITKAITVDEFMHGRKRTDGTRIDKGTGLKSDRSVKDGLKAAIKHGYLVFDVDETDKARIKKSYALKMHDTGQVDTTPQVDVSENRQVVSTPQTGSIYPSDIQNLPIEQVVSTPRSEKHTIERNYRNTPEKEGITISDEIDAPTPIYLEMRKRKTDPSMVAVSGSHMDIGNVPTEKFERQKQATFAHMIGEQNGRPDDATDDSRPATGDTHYTVSLVSSGPLHRVSSAPSTEVPEQIDSPLAPHPSNTPGQQAGESPGTLVSASAVQGDKPKCDTKELQRRINEHRGYALEEATEIIRERKAVKSWCNLHTLEEYELVMAKLKKDTYWGKEENYYRIGGLTLAIETPKMLAPIPIAKKKDPNIGVSGLPRLPDLRDKYGLGEKYG